ncbi:unnamed protein product [Paramecium primaurelia]|uniref:Uncharacterized protein n=1 Tax=Paramecium primaurelia TaxID=5886 RepID=A0A8S1NWY5_PARPR|nr:unnamed protein product [Paramecium primaurelia]CAD8094037.1 unnamed protein product [Paramecium primaurelia]
MIFFIIVIILIAIILAGFVYSLNKAGPKRTYNVDLTGKIAIVTGSSAGVGKETAKKLALRGATVIFACRNKEKTQIIIDEISKISKNNNLHYINLDLPNFDSVRQFVKEFKQRFNRCDYLINNAGIFIINLQKNNLNQELTFATNHLGHFLLTNLLLDIMSDKSRIINVSSGAHEFVKKIPDFQKAIKGELSLGMNTYATSKFANILFTQALQQKFDKENRRIKAVSIHPGFVRTEIYHSKNGSNRFLSAIAIVVIGLMSQFSLNEEEGSRTTEYTMFQPYEELVPSGYYQKNQLSKSTKLVRECGLETMLWDLSTNAVDL